MNCKSPNSVRQGRQSQVQFILSVVSISLFLPLLFPLTAGAADPIEVFVHQVLPIFRQKCFSCHGDDVEEIRGELNMLTREGLLKGGESEEPAIVPGDATASPLFQAVNWDGLEMPPKENDRLSAEQIAHLREWIDGDAPWPSQQRIDELTKIAAENGSSAIDADASGVSVKTSGGLSADWTNRKYDPKNLWAYQPLWNDKNALLRGVANPIDTLIDLQLKERAIEPAPPADRQTLIRRVTFDLLGLPPTSEEVDEYLKDPASDREAFKSVVERLLASPHYGEHWGQHWLDVARYADSSGFANDFERGNAWRYRDYVVRAFNTDKPYDQFVREQIAGDEIDATAPELLVAAGFLRMGPWELTGMEVEKIARQRFLDDVTDSVGQVFLGHMLQCARCHDHKFDPVPTRDYYGMQAIFATTQLAERKAEFLDVESQEGFEESKYLKKRFAFYEQQQKEVDKRETIAAARTWFDEQERDPTEFERVLGELKQDSGEVHLRSVRNEMAKQGISPELIPPKKSGFEPKDFGLERICRKEHQRLGWRLERYQPFAFSVYSGKTPTLKNVAAPLRMPKEPARKGELEQTAILTGGDPFSPADEVLPATLSIVDLSDVPSPPAEITGRRTALANWIASKRNPLTARVMVNRIWQWHFGQPIAGNPNNFGTTGKKPSHPKLLDYLAQHFMDEGWSIKAVHRLILASDAYQRSSKHSDDVALEKADPDGVSYARFTPRRLTAEEVRDAMLHCSGELNLAVGGIPVRPEMNLEAALQPRMVMGTFAEAWQPSPQPSQRHRRSLYALHIRGQRDPFLEVFNAPSSETSCESREASMVTPQVFAMFNSEISFDRALALANRILKADHSEKDAVRQLFRIVFARSATEDEVGVCLEHWSKMTERHMQLTFAKPRYPTEVVRVAVEENTGVKFTYTEPLEMYEDFVPDLKPSDAIPELRGLAEVCLVLLNSNEFAYVY